MPRVFPSLEPTTLLIHKGKALPFHQFDLALRLRLSLRLLASTPFPHLLPLDSRSSSPPTDALRFPSLYTERTLLQLSALSHSPSRPFMGLIVVRYQLAAAIPLPMSPVACPMLLEVKIRALPPSSFSRRAGRADE